MSWICSKCETENPDRLKICEVCDSPRDISPADELKEKLKEKYSDAAYKSFIRYHYELLESADKGDASAQAQYRVAEWFNRSGSSGSSNDYIKIAVSWYQKAAMKGHIDAQLKLASCYEEGRGVPKIKEEALKWYKIAANVGNVIAWNKYLRLKYNNKTYESVIKYKFDLLSAADKGERNSQYLLGEWFSNHKSKSEYREEAVVWYTKAAKNGHGGAMFKLGECYETGFGVYTNLDEAFKWYKKSANCGNKSACMIIAQSYLYGWQKKNVDEAIKWYEKAGNDINGTDLRNIGHAYDVGDGVTKNIIKAADYYKRAADKGDMVAQYHLGVCFENGDGVNRNKKTAKYWYEKAASQGHEQAKVALSRLNSRAEKIHFDSDWICYFIFGMMETVGFIYYTNEPQNSWIHYRFVSLFTNELWIETGAIILIAGAWLMSLIKGGPLLTLLYGCFAFGFYLNQPENSWLHREILSLSVSKHTNVVFEWGTTLLAVGTWLVCLIDDD